MFVSNLSFKICSGYNNESCFYIIPHCQDLTCAVLNRAQKKQAQYKINYLRSQTAGDATSEPTFKTIARDSATGVFQRACNPVADKMCTVFSVEFLLFIHLCNEWFVALLFLFLTLIHIETLLSQIVLL